MARRAFRLLGGGWPRAALVLIGIVVAATAYAASLSPAQRVVEQVSEGLMRVLREDRHLLETDPAYVHRLVDELFLPNIDFDRVSALILGRYWRDSTPRQRRAFQRAFKDMLINTYAHAMNSLSDWEIRYLPSRPGPDVRRVTVRTEILYGGRKPIPVDYRMVYEDARWLAYDVSVDGISLLTTFRSIFTGIARERGLDGLIRELERRNGTLLGVESR